MILMLRTALRTATFSKGNVAQELRRDSSCAALPFAVLVLRYLLYCLFLIFLYVFFNIGMVTGLIPVVGAPLPFISNGGTSLITIFIGLGIIQSIRVSRNV